MESNQSDVSRRSFVRATAYAVPVILTLKARPAHASAGSGQFGNAKLRNDVEQFVSDLRKSEHGQLSAEDRDRMQKQVKAWQADGTDVRVQRAIDGKLKELKRSGNFIAANRIKEEVAHLTQLVKKLMRF